MLIGYSHLPSLQHWSVHTLTLMQLSDIYRTVLVINMMVKIFFSRWDCQTIGKQEQVSLIFDSIIQAAAHLSVRRDAAYPAEAR
jgi:hypothetical protein